MINNDPVKYQADTWTIRVAAIVIALMMLGAGALVALQIHQREPVSPFLTLFLGVGLVAIRSLFIEKKAVDSMNGIHEKVDVAATKALETSERGKQNRGILEELRAGAERQRQSFEYFDSEVKRIHDDHARISREHARIMDAIANLSERINK